MADNNSLVITKAELIKRICDYLPSLHTQTTVLATKAILALLSHQLISGKRIEIRNFGSFSLKKRAARIVRNPKTGETFTLQNSYSVQFKTGKKLRENINKLKFI